MLTLIKIGVGLAIGFGVGVWYGVQHPDWAKDFAAREEEKFLEYKIQVAQATKAKLEQIAGRSSAPAGSSSFVGGSGKVDSDVKRLSVEQDQEIAELQKQLSRVKKK